MSHRQVAAVGLVIVFAPLAKGDFSTQLLNIDHWQRGRDGSVQVANAVNTTSPPASFDNTGLMGPTQNRVIATLAGSQLKMDTRNGVEVLQGPPFMIAHTNSGNILFTADAPFTVAGQYFQSNGFSNGASFVKVQSSDGHYWQYGYAPGDNGQMVPYPRISGDLLSIAPPGEYSLSWSHTPGWQMSNFTVDWYQATLTTVPEPTALGAMAVGVMVPRRRR
jgi:hypothetical protein